MRCFLILPLLGIAAAAGAQPPNVQTDGAAVVRACVRPGQENQQMSELSAAERDRLMRCFQREAARQVNAQTPIRIDELSTVHSVTAEGTQLTYHVRVDLSAAAVNSEQRGAVQRSTRNNVCGQEAMRQTMSNGGSYRYIWTDRAGAEITRTVIAGC